MARCTCKYRKGEGPGDEPLEKDPYCPFHGRIRDMDAGASPFVDPNISATVSDMYESDYQRRLVREANEADARRGTDRPMTRSELLDALAREVNLEFLSPEGHERVRKAVDDVVDFPIIPRGCNCTYSQEAEGTDWILTHIEPSCPTHGEKTDESA